MTAANKSKRVPQYRRHKPSGQAVVTLAGKDHYLGQWKSAASKVNYDRLIGEWLASGRTAPATSSAEVFTVTQLIARYWAHAEVYYVKHGRPTSEQACIRAALGPLKRLYGSLPVESFGPLALKAVRQAFINDDHARGSTNHHADRIKRMFRWGVENELVPSSVYEALRAVAGLKRGRCEARESEPVRPVPDEFVDATLPHLPATVRAMVELQRITGMRSGELTTMRGCDLDMSGSIWTYTPASHKTEHHGRARPIHLGPRAQEIIRPYLKAELSAYLFSPVASEQQRREDRHAARVTPMSCGNRPGSSRTRRPRRPPGQHYAVTSYARAITRACELADQAAREQAIREGRKIEAGERLIPHWHPHQLRHNAATRLRREFGIEAARVVLGHTSAAVTEIYAEVDHAKAREVMARVG